MSKKDSSSLSKDIRVFGNVKALCTAAFLAALAVVISYVCKSFTVTMSVRITFENLPLILSGYVFGPWVGLLTGLCSDITSTAANYGIGGINPILTIGSASVGFISGIVSHYLVKKTSVVQIFLSTFASHMIGNMAIKTIGLYIYYATPPAEIAVRIGIYTAIAIIEAIILTIMLKSRGIKKAIGALKI